MQVVASEFAKRGGHVESPRSVTDQEITRIHDPDYLTSIKETAGRAVAIDPDTFTSPGTGLGGVSGGWRRGHRGRARSR
jgi:acetoin utilization deacetylase AcuC-like enzyme